MINARNYLLVRMEHWGYSMYGERNFETIKVFGEFGRVSEKGN